jgi:protein gp37
VAEHTDIEWADSTLNLQMGCDGCELWNPKTGVKHCYAGELTERYGGRAGWPASFSQPKLFPERLDKALRWKDLTGTDRPEKPWLTGRPRIIFLNDMGDTFTESLPIDWLAPFLPRMADSPHQFLLLTKRPNRMLQFSRQYPLPINVWPMTSLTSEANAGRSTDLLQVDGGGPKGLSCEPLLGPIRLMMGLASKEWYRRIGFVIVGGESGPGARPCRVEWIRSIRDQCKSAGVPCFVKQLGSNPVGDERPEPTRNADGSRTITVMQVLEIRDRKGGDWNEWPADLRVREFPTAEATR